MTSTVGVLGADELGQVPFGDMENPEHVRLLEHWMVSYRPQELFDANGRLAPQLAELAPRDARRMGWMWPTASHG